MSINFSSDNATPACEAVLAAVNAANRGDMPSYGADELSARLRARVCDLFEKDCEVYPVTTGTAANALALAQIAPPYGAVYCHESAHIVTDECGAPEFYGGGLKLIGLPAADGKIRPQQLRASFELADDMGVHHVKPSAISITQATEWGTVYRLDEIAQIGAMAGEREIPVHMDGARFANALVQLGCSPAEATWKHGIDVLSLGATKNGALCAEAVVFFDARLAHDFDRRRKRAGHLWSKFRYLSAQLLAYLEHDLWLTNARHANAMAQRLGAGLSRVPGAMLLQQVEANEVFVALAESQVATLERDFKFYRWPPPRSDGRVTIRLVTSYATPDADVAAFLAAAARLAA